MTVEFKKTQIFYTTKGSGDAMVLLHGFLESSNIWKDFITEYSGQKQLISVDLPGHGKSGCLADVHTMEEMAEAVYAVLKELKIKKACFIGHSMGGYVALAFTEMYPQLVGKLVLLNSTPAADSEERKLNRERAITVVKKNKEAFVSMAVSNLLTPENFKKFRSQLEIIKSEAMKFPTKGITAALKGMKFRTDKTEVLKQFSGEKFILAGEKDPILNFEEINTIARATNSSLYSFPDGHLTVVENKEQFLQTVYFIE